MIKKFNFAVFICIFIIVAGTSLTFGQATQDSLKDKRITIHMDKQPFGKIIEHLIVNYDIPIGFEESVLDREHNDYEFETNLPFQNKIDINGSDKNSQISITKERVFIVKQNWFSINAENSRLEDVLNIIVRQMRNYKWEINDGVINIIPINGRDKNYERLLELKIQNFELGVISNNLKKNIRISEIRTQLFKLPEIANFLDENKIDYRKLYRESIDNLNRKIPNTLKFSNITLKDLLNKITKEKRGGWILKKSDIYDFKEQDSVEINI